MKTILKNGAVSAAQVESLLGIISREVRECNDLSILVEQLQSCMSIRISNADSCISIMIK